MVVLPSGSFTMGSPEDETGRLDSEGPQRPVRIGYQFAVGKYEVTVDEYRSFATQTGRSSSGGCWTWDGGAWKEMPSTSWQSPGFSQAGNHPVTCVSWEDAHAYVTWLNEKTGLTGRSDRYRLLSEAEWEYAARAGTTGRFSNNGGEAELCQIANGADLSTGYSDGNTACSDGYGMQTAPVGSFMRNGFGLHDMHGNVWEWVEDCYEAGYSVQPSDGSAFTKRSCSYRVVRGGSWDYTPQDLRSAGRYRNAPGNRSNLLGFRLARTLP
jgi:formylglycine-generating enzyme required for sulfatase activity